MNPASAYIMEKEEPFRSIMMHLRSVMEYYVPAAELRYKWKVPYFYLFLITIIALFWISLTVLRKSLSSL